MRPRKGSSSVFIVARTSSNVIIPPAIVGSLVLERYHPYLFRILVLLLLYNPFCFLLQKSMTAIELRLF